MKKLKFILTVLALLFLSTFLYQAISAPSDLTIDNIATSNLSILGNVYGNVGNLTSDTSGVLISGRIGAVIGSGVDVHIQNATGTQSGLLTSTD